MKTATIALATLVLSFFVTVGLVSAQSASPSPMVTNSPSPMVTTSPSPSASGQVQGASTVPSGAPNTGHAL
jgi:hypothetical protein